MSIEINNTNVNPRNSADAKPVEAHEAKGHESRTQESKKSDDQGSVRRDSVELSRDAHSLKQLQERLEQQDSFDAERVAEIKAAIAEGRYPIDNERLARNFYELESKLNQ